MEATTIIRQIEASFPAEPLPAMTLRQAVLADQTLTRRIPDAEWSAERLRDGHITWPNLPDSVLMECEVGFAHLDEEAFTYYLGALMKFAVTHIAKDLFAAEGRVVGTAVFSVTNRSAYNLSRLKRLTDGQIDAVIAFLRFVETNSETHGVDASKALTRYWLKPDARQRQLFVHPNSAFESGRADKRRAAQRVKFLSPSLLPRYHLR